MEYWFNYENYIEPKRSGRICWRKTVANFRKWSDFSIPIPAHDKNSPHLYNDVVINDINAADMLSLVGAKKLHANTIAILILY